VEGTLDLESFQRLLEPRGLVRRRLLAAFARLLPSLLGERRWPPLRARILASRLGPWLDAELPRAALLASAVGLALALLGVTWAALLGL